MSVGTPAAINARATSSLAFDGSMTSSPRRLRPLLVGQRAQSVRDLDAVL
jgi:hypothetical protein